MTAVKRIGCAVVALLLCALLCACGLTEPYQSPLEQLNGSFAESDALANYRIILPSDATAELAIAARELAEDIARRTEADVTVRYEHEADCYTGEDVLILLGWLEATQEEMRTLKRDDYVCKMNADGHVVLGGRAASATLAALERFRTEILPAASKLALMHPDAGFLHLEEYAVKALSLNGFDLQEYRIVLEESENETVRRLTYWLRDEIAAKSGYYLTVLEGEEFDGKGRFLSLRLDRSSNAPQEAHVLPMEQGIVLRADSAYGVSLAVRAFADVLADATLSEPAACEIVQDRILPYETVGAELGLISAEDLLLDNDIESLYAILDRIANGGEDCFFVDSVPERDVHYFDENLKERVVLSEILENGSAFMSARKPTAKLRALKTDFLEEQGLTVSVWQVGEDRDGFRLILLGGALTCDTEVALSAYMDGATLPTAVVSHVRTGEFSLAISDAESLGLAMLCNDRYQTENDRKTVGFCVYGDSTCLSAEILRKDDAGGYRALRLERISAIELSEK